MVSAQIQLTCDFLCSVSAGGSVILSEPKRPQLAQLNGDCLALKVFVLWRTD